MGRRKSLFNRRVWAALASAAMAVFATRAARAAEITGRFPGDSSEIMSDAPASPIVRVPIDSSHNNVTITIPSSTLQVSSAGSTTIVSGGDLILNEGGNLFGNTPVGYPVAGAGLTILTTINNYGGATVISGGDLVITSPPTIPTQLLSVGGTLTSPILSSGSGVVLLSAGSLTFSTPSSSTYSDTIELFFPDSVSVPEPTSISFLAFAGLLLGRRRRK